jgi:hypothetical protein
MPRVLVKTSRAVAFLLLTLTLGACGASSRERALRSSLASVNTAQQGFLAWDKTHQDQIVQHATSLEGGTVAIQIYRARREAISLAFEVAYKAIAVAALEATEANATAAIMAVADLYVAIKRLQEQQR